MFPPENLPVSKPCNPVKDGVSQNISIILNVASDGFGGASPPPVFFRSFLNPLNSLLTMLWRFFHLSLTSCVVLGATPSAFTAAAIFSQT